MKKKFELIPPGAVVKIIGPGIIGRIEQVSLREFGAKYEIEYWIGTQITSVWLYDTQFEIHEGEQKNKIGFL